MKTSLVALGSILLACLVTVAAAQTYPSKPIRIIVPFGPGGTADIIARIIGQTLSKELSQQVVVENKPGAGGTIGTAEAARAAPDGHTLTLGSGTTVAIGPLTTPNAGYDAYRAFQGITLVVTVPNLISVHSALPVKTPAELVDFLKKNPDTTFISGTTGLTTTHLSGEFFAHQIGVKLTHVPYKVVGQALIDVASGRVKLAVYALGGSKNQVDSGALRAIAVMSAQRVAAMPNVPTLAETVLPGFDVASWFGLIAPVGTPRAIIDRLHGIVSKSIDTPEMRKQIEANVMVPNGMGPDRFQEHMRIEYERWREAIQASGYTPQ